MDDARRSRQASGCSMLMLGRGAVTNPGLALAIKADMAGTELAPLRPLSPGISWAVLLPPLIAA